MKAIDPRWCYIKNVEVNPTTCLLTLPGRGGKGSNIASWHLDANLNETLIVGVTPEGQQWYPMPKGANDQEEAVAGQSEAVDSIRYILETIEKEYGITKEHVAIAGFSAGGVMAIQAGIHIGGLAAVVCYGGAILDTDTVPEAKDNTPMYILHNMDDDNFDWYERYLPMKKALKENHYKAKFIERMRGGHQMKWEDITICGAILGHHFGCTGNIDAADINKAMDEVSVSA